MSRLFRYKVDPSGILRNALILYRSGQIKTVLVEGVCDKRFLQQWDFAGKIRLEVCYGKDCIEETYRRSLQGEYVRHDFLGSIADVDYDYVSGKGLIRDPKFIYNAFCNETESCLYNDLECFLINTRAFEKILANFDCDVSQADDLRIKIEKASRDIGAYRAADFIIQRKNSLQESVLNGIEIRGFLNESTLTIDIPSMEKAMPIWSRNSRYIGDLVDRAHTLKSQLVKPWALSRGHDVSELLAVFLNGKGHRGIDRERVEMLLRLGCDSRNFLESPMGKQLNALIQA